MTQKEAQRGTKLIRVSNDTYKHLKKKRDEAIGFLKTLRFPTHKITLDGVIRGILATDEAKNLKVQEEVDAGKDTKILKHI